MCPKEVIWLPVVREKLLTFQSEHFTAAKTLEFVVTLILEAEEVLRSDIVARTYTEEFGAYRRMSRIVVRKFRIY